MKKKKRKTQDSSTPGSMCPPINTNVLPAGSSQQPMPSAGDATLAKTGCAESIMVHGLLDVAVEKYTKGQYLPVSNETFQENLNKARDVTIEKLPLSHAGS